MTYDEFISFIVKNLFKILKSNIKSIIVMHRINKRSPYILFIPSKKSLLKEYEIRTDYYYRKYKIKLFTEEDVINEIIYCIQQKKGE